MEDNYNLVNYLQNNFILISGIWYSQNCIGDISYTIQGNNTCFELEDDSFWFQHRNKCLVPIVRKFDQNGYFFDIGGGNGCVSKAIQD